MTDPIAHAYESPPRQFIDPSGEVKAELPDFALEREEVIRLYRGMSLTRAFDEKAVSLQRTGRLGTFASSLGQEAVSVGLASAMQQDDVLVPSFREQGAQLWRGVTVEEILLYWGGDERGSDFAGPRADFPVSIPVASHTLHAAGVALAFKLRQLSHCAVAVAGDGATSKGDFYEAINLAGVWRLPVVFIVCNNGWAISVPRESQTAAATLAQKGVAAGIPGVQVDGNDIIAMKATVQGALDHARAGRGPTLIEALTYRLSDHTTADDASRYRNDEEVARQWLNEPLSRVRSYLVGQFAWSKEEEKALTERVQSEVNDGAERYLKSQPQSAQSLFDHLYFELPAELAEQRAEVIALSKTRLK